MDRTISGIQPWITIPNTDSGTISAVPKWPTCRQLQRYCKYISKTPDTLRSENIDLQFYKKWCNDAYKMDAYDVWPNVETTETYWGGLNLNVDHLIMTNGGEDPW